MNPRIFLLIVILAAILSSCQPQKSYIRTYNHIPQTDQAGDIELSGAMAMNHVEGMMAFSPLDHVNILAQGYAGSRGSVYELGAGLYYKFDQVKFQFTSGMGKAVLKSSTLPYRSSTYGYQDTRTYYVQNSAFDKIFIQPSIEFEINENFSFGFSKRFNWVSYTKWELKEVQEIYNYPDLETPYELNDRTSMVGDLFCFVNWKLDPLCASFQLGTTDDDFRGGSLPRYSENYFNIALGINLNAFNKKKPDNQVQALESY